MPSSHPAHLPIEPDLTKCATLLRDGAILVYPTETYYAIGCLANCPKAVENIFLIKQRPLDKPLPLIAASHDQATLAADLSMLPSSFLQNFWPGPLTLIVPGKNVDSALLNTGNKLAIRVSSQTLATNLAYEAGFPLVATSANLTGNPAASCYENLDISLLERAASFSAAILPYAVAGAGQPSTIVEPLLTASGLVLKIHRPGIIPASELIKWMPIIQ